MRAPGFQGLFSHPTYLPTWTCALLKTLLGIRPVLSQRYSHTRIEKKMSLPRRYVGDRCLGYSKHSQPSQITPGLLVRQTPCITEYYNWVYQLAVLTGILNRNVTTSAEYPNRISVTFRFSVPPQTQPPLPQPSRCCRGSSRPHHGSPLSPSTKTP